MLLLWQPVAVSDVGGGAGGKRKKRKQHIAPWDLAWQETGYKRPIPLIQPEIDQETPPEVVEVINAKAHAEALAKATIEHRREISRIRAQMRLSSNEAAHKAMEAEIGKIEAHLAKLKQEAEDMLLLTLIT